mgnify:CR=1 FL=1
MAMISSRFQPVLILVGAIWIVEVVNLFLGHRLVSFGILPRSFSGLIGIPLAPLLHGGFWHAVFNTVPLFILGALTLAGGRSEEHTSELQSRRNLVCRLLLEKKKTTKNNKIIF